MANPTVEISKIISHSVATLEYVCQQNNLPFPHPDEPFTPSSEAFRANPEAAEAANKIVAAALQLAATVLPPSAAITGLASGHFKSAALRGLHVREIAAKSNSSTSKLGKYKGITVDWRDIIPSTARLMRYLATHHVYRETSPDVFTNTQVSSMLDTGKPVAELFSSPESRYGNTHGFPALAGYALDEVPKSSAYLWETMTYPVSAYNDEVTKTAFNKAFNACGIGLKILNKLNACVVSDAQCEVSRPYNHPMSFSQPSIGICYPRARLSSMSAQAS